MMEQAETTSRSDVAAGVVAYVVRAVALVAGIGAAVLAKPYGTWAALGAFAGTAGAGEWLAERIELGGWEFVGWTLALTALAAATLLSLAWMSSVVSSLTPGAVVVFVLVFALLNRKR